MPHTEPSEHLDRTLSPHAPVVEDPPEPLTEDPSESLRPQAPGRTDPTPLFRPFPADDARAPEADESEEEALGETLHPSGPSPALPAPPMEGQTRLAPVPPPSLDPKALSETLPPPASVSPAATLPQPPPSPDPETLNETLAPPVPWRPNGTLPQQPPPPGPETLGETLPPPPLQPSESGDGGTLFQPRPPAAGPGPGYMGETLPPPPSRTPSGDGPGARLSQAPTRRDPSLEGKPPSAAPSSPVPGYEILGVLGQGGMGIVYKARHIALDRIVALKMILRGALADRESVERFRIEAQAVARLRHPNIVQIYEVGEHAGQPFFSLEYLDGGSLQQQLQKSPQEAKKAAQLMETLARAVQHAHEQRIIHRDLKPANVLLGADGTPKVTDFGLAKRIEEQDQNHTAAEAILGTPTYMAPEQASGKTREVGPAADIYSLGAIFYDVLTGRPPLRGTTLMDTLHLVQHTEPVPPRRLQPKVPLDLQTICLKCLEKDPRRRYASAGVLADDLRSFLEGRPISARPVSVAERAWKWARRRPAEALLVLAGVLGLTALLAGLAVFAVQQKQLADAADLNASAARHTADVEKQHNQELEAKQKEILKAQHEAESKGALATQNLGQARRAIAELLEVSQKHLPNEPHLVGLRERILVFAQNLAQHLLDQQGGDAEVRREAAQTTRLVGDIQETLGQHDKAAKSYGAAAELYEELLKEKEPRPEWVQEAAGNDLNRWVVLAKEKPDEAAKALDRAKVLLEGLVRDNPEEGAYQRDLALCLNNQAIEYLLADDSPRCESSLQQALELFKHMPSGEVGQAGTQLEFARTEKNLGVLYHRTGRWPEAEEQYRQAMKRLEPLVKAEPEVPAYQLEFGPVFINLGVLLTDEGRSRYADALAVYDDAIGVCGPLNEKFPEVADYRRLLALAHAGRGELYRRRGDREKAFADLDETRKLLEQMPDRSSIRLDLVRTLNTLGGVEDKGADPDAARRDWERALSLWREMSDDEREKPEARAEFHRACSELIGWHDARARKATEAGRWADAAAEMRTLIDMRRKRLGSFDTSPEAHADEAAAAVVGVFGAAVVPGLLQERQRDGLASTRLALARSLSQTHEYHEGGDVLDALLIARSEVPGHWARYPEAAAIAARFAGQSAADRDAFTRRAVALLHRAVEEGVAVPPGLLDSDAFEPLRDSRDFQQVRVQLTRQATAKPPR